MTNNQLEEAQVEGQELAAALVPMISYAAESYHYEAQAALWRGVLSGVVTAMCASLGENQAAAVIFIPHASATPAPAPVG